MCDVMRLKLGHIDYLNCVPLFHYLRESGFDGAIVKGVPAELNQKLAQGEVDVSPSSSFEYGRNYRDYLLLPGHSISALREVKSVLLFSPVPIEQLRGRRIFLTGESATSVHLLKVLLQAFYGWETVPSVVPDVPVETLLERGEPVLLIGDRALKASMSSEKNKGYCYDLAQLWYRHTQLPFVFALWIVRRESFKELSEPLQRLRGQLALSRQKAFEDLTVLAESTRGRDWITGEQLIEYWQSMSYYLDAQHVAGLKYFFELCVTYGYLPEMPEIDFVPCEDC
jgi:chorismate dehydratase